MPTADSAVELLWDPKVQIDPYPAYRHLRGTRPVAWHAAQNSWVLTRHRDVMAALRDPALSAARVNIWPDAGPEDRQMVDFLSQQILFMDPPDHTRVRQLMAKTFTPRMIAGLRPAITALVDDLLDRAEPGGGMDLVADFASPLPVNVIAEMLGVPWEDHHRLREWSGAFGRLLDGNEMTPDELRWAVSGLAEFVAYLSVLVERRRAQPRADLISELVAVEEHGDRLNLMELLVNLVLLLAAGHATTTHLLGNGTLALLRHRDQWDLLCDEPSLAPQAVQELLRYESPVLATSRVAAEDVEIGGELVRKGQGVIALLGAANRDPEVFDDPDRLDLRRPAGRHLAFGYGIHTCLGMALARAEGEIAFERLTARLPTLRLAVDGPGEWNTGLIFRGLRRLDVRWDSSPTG